MKNSLFKRAIAAASALPLALTQCLTTANAANISVPTADNAVAAGEAKAITLSDEGTGLVYIDPAKAAGATDDGYERVDDSIKFEKFSTWNYQVNNALTGKALSGKVKTDKIFEEIINKTPGNYKVVAEALLDKVTSVTYEVTATGDVIIKGKLDNITPRFVNDTKKTRKTIGGALYSIVEDYGAADLYNSMDSKGLYTDLAIGGEMTAVIKSSALAEGTEVEVEVSFKDLNGKTYVGSKAMAKWALDSLEAVKARAKEIVASYADKYSIDLADANKRIDDSVKYYEDKLNLSETKIENAIAKSIAETAYGTIPAMMEKGGLWFENNGGRVADKYDAPKSVTEAASKAAVKDIYSQVLNAVNKKQSTVAVDITLDEIAQFADNEIYDVVASTEGGVSKLTAKFADKEKDAAIAYIADCAKNATDEKYAGIDYNDTANWDAWKEVSVEVDFSAVPDSSKGKVDVQLKRVVEVTPIVTTTTTTTEVTTTTTAVTETTPTDTTPTDTTKAGQDVSTTPTDTTKAGQDVSTTPTDTTVAEPGSSTTPTDTNAVEPGSSTTPTDTTAVEPGTSTTDVYVSGTTRAVQETVVHFNNTETVGFYLNLDDKFNDEQKKDITYSIDESILYIDEFNEVVGDTIIKKGAEVAIGDKVDFGTQVPRNVYDPGVSEFAHQIDIYATEDITAADGTVIGKKGEILKNRNGSNVSVTAYVALKGDGNLDNFADAVDASLCLTWYANMSTGGDAEKTQFSSSFLVKGVDDILDDFTAFLCDVDNEKSATNWIDRKPARIIDAKDASFILSYYAMNSTGSDGGKPVWHDVLGEYAPY